MWFVMVEPRHFSMCAYFVFSVACKELVLINETGKCIVEIVFVIDTPLC